MAVELERVVLPDYADVKIRVSARINITDVAAQRKVSRLLLDLVGTQLYGESPSPVAGQWLVWRVPVWLGLPTAGPVGRVGTLDVDTQTGEVQYTQQLLDELAEHGDGLAQRATLGRVCKLD